MYLQINKSMERISKNRLNQKQKYSKKSYLNQFQIIEFQEEEENEISNECDLEVFCILNGRLDKIESTFISVGNESVIVSNFQYVNLNN